MRRDLEAMSAVVINSVKYLKKKSGKYYSLFDMRSKITVLTKKISFVDYRL